MPAITTLGRHYCNTGRPAVRALAFGCQVHVLDLDGTWKLAVVTAVHEGTRSVSIVTRTTSSIQKSRQHSIDKHTWLRDVPSAMAE